MEYILSLIFTTLLVWLVEKLANSAFDWLIEHFFSCGEESNSDTESQAKSLEKTNETLSR